MVLDWFNLFLDMIADLIRNFYTFPLFAGVTLGQFIIVTAVSGMLIGTFVSRGRNA